jgi:hypothetical protein
VASLVVSLTCAFRTIISKVRDTTFNECFWHKVFVKNIFKKTKIMSDKNEEQDRHLQAPEEANRDKHINFLAEERGEEDPADEGRQVQRENDHPKNVYAKDEDRDRHLQAPTEANRDKHINFLAEERGEQDPADQGKGGDITNSESRGNDNPVYTNNDAPQQEIEKDSKGAMSKGTKDDASAVYSTDNSTLQSKEEKEHDEKIDPEKNDHIETGKASDTEADDRFLRRGENLNKE